MSKTRRTRDHDKISLNYEGFLKYPRHNMSLKYTPSGATIEVIIVDKVMLNINIHRT